MFIFKKYNGATGMTRSFILCALTVLCVAKAESNEPWSKQKANDLFARINKFQEDGSFDSLAFDAVSQAMKKGLINSFQGQLKITSLPQEILQQNDKAAPFLFIMIADGQHAYFPQLKALASSNPTAQYYLGRCYSLGLGVEKNSKEALKWYKQAAEQGLAEAQSNLGLCYLVGDGVEKNPHEAIKWFKQAAEQGFAQARYSLGRCYSGEFGIEMNPQEAVKWFKQAAEQGLAEAQGYLGRCYSHGFGVEMNPQEAVKWFKLGAEGGDAGTQYTLAECYQNGLGVEIDLQEAAKWFERAKEQGRY